jgi:hypothetical protein
MAFDPLTKSLQLAIQVNIHELHKYCRTYIDTTDGYDGSKKEFLQKLPVAYAEGLFFS